MKAVLYDMHNLITEGELKSQEKAYQPWRMIHVSKIVTIELISFYPE
jgi:hypothetical protein